MLSGRRPGPGRGAQPQFLNDCMDRPQGLCVACRASPITWCPSNAPLVPPIRSPTALAAGSVRNFKSKNGTRKQWGASAPLFPKFVSECAERITNFGNGALMPGRRVGVVTPETLSPIGGDIGVAISSSRSTRTTGTHAHPSTPLARSRSPQRFLCRLQRSPQPHPPAHAQSVEEFYKGKTITISVGYSPGGCYDFYPRVFARHMGKYIPGHPTVVVQNMPGAGSLRAANYLSTSRPRTAPRSAW